ncbi:hypothetical protein M422DRAFT_778091 [Sphaerobolus stellatus SS14]|nr:hypothetical protein M422DRAFT_778091 [Sphaerobolus stellatus SS14]
MLTPPLSRQRSNARSPRAATVPLASSNGQFLLVPKRIVVFCDGTWQDGISARPADYSNVSKLFHMMKSTDPRTLPPRVQVFGYFSGVGTETSMISDMFEGATGASLGLKVQEAYAFIARNYQPHDEIFLFGFSRGAYTARMVAMLIGEIGILNNSDMEKFPDIFLALEKRVHIKDETEKANVNEFLKPFTSPTADGRIRADADGDTFTVKCIGVFDTVGALGIPCELKLDHKVQSLFGFPDCFLGEHIENAFHAMALDETREDFEVAKFKQTPKGRDKRQVLRQVWFSGSHTDIGGGYHVHDLSDITLTWMAACVENMLYMDHAYLPYHIRPVRPWGTLSPHNSCIGVFKLSHRIHRQLPPPEGSLITLETFHPSVFCQPGLPFAVRKLIDGNPALLEPLLPLEEQIKKGWIPISAEEAKLAISKDEYPLIKRSGSVTSRRFSSFVTLLKSVSHFGENTVEKKSVSATVEVNGGGDGPSHEERTWMTAVDKELGRKPSRRQRQSLILKFSK